MAESQTRLVVSSTLRQAGIMGRLETCREIKMLTASVLETKGIEMPVKVSTWMVQRTDGMMSSTSASSSSQSGHYRKQATHPDKRHCHAMNGCIELFTPRASRPGDLDANAGWTRRPLLFLLRRGLSAAPALCVGLVRPDMPGQLEEHHKMEGSHQIVGCQACCLGRRPHGQCLCHPHVVHGPSNVTSHQG